MTLSELAILMQKKAAEDPDKEVCVIVADSNTTEVIACTWESKHPTLTRDTTRLLKNFK